MKRCPNCGFYNFDISATCGRCETPLTNTAEKQQAPAAATPAQPAPAASGAKVVPPAAAAATIAAKEAIPSGTAPANNAQPAAKELRHTTAQKLARLELELVSLPPLAADQEGDIANELPRKQAAELPEEELLGDLPEEPVTDNPIQQCVVKTPQESAIEVTLPRFWRRLAATLIDTMVFVILLAIAFWLTISNSPNTVNGFSSYYGFDLFIDFLLAYPLEIGQGLILATVLTVLYHGLAVGLGGKTIGYALLGITVKSRKTGDKPSIFAAMFRALVMVISTLFLGLGFFWRIIDPLRRDFGDLAAKTVVVRK